MEVGIADVVEEASEIERHIDGGSSLCGLSGLVWLQAVVLLDSLQAAFPTCSCSASCSHMLRGSDVDTSFVVHLVCEGEVFVEHLPGIPKSPSILPTVGLQLSLQIGQYLLQLDDG